MLNLINNRRFILCPSLNMGTSNFFKLSLSFSQAGTNRMVLTTFIKLTSQKKSRNPKALAGNYKSLLSKYK